jgi:hypothetical protein
MTDITEPPTPAPPPADHSARAAFLAWERLRLAYNAALGTVVLLTAGADGSAADFPWFLAYAAFGANLCFCLGPVAEGYLVLLFRADRRAARWLVFVPGLLLACAMAAVSMTCWRLLLPD